MRPMGSEKAVMPQKAEQRPELDDDTTEIAVPEDCYGIACIGCGIELHLQMIPHRDQHHLLVGWVFCCEKCRPNIIGRRVWFGNDSAKVQGPSKDWDKMLHYAERLYQTACSSHHYEEELEAFVKAWDVMLD